MKLPLGTPEQTNSSSSPLFFRAVDRLRLEGYVLALTQEGMSLSVVSTHEAILDHYGKILVSRLRQAAPDVAIEVYFPASSEALLGRFNEVLVNSSIQDAMNGKVTLATPRIWIVHDASALPDHEIELLARLVQHFPAANIRVVLLMTAASQKTNLLSSFGRSILCWDVEPPTPEQAQTLLEQATVEGREAAARSLLKKLSIPLTRQTEPETLASTTLPVVAPIEDSRAPPEEARPRRGAWRWLLGGLALLLISALSMAMFYVSSQGAARLHWNWQALLAGNNPMTNDAVTVPPASAPVAATGPSANASPYDAAASASGNVASLPAAAVSAPAAVANATVKAIESVEPVKEAVIEPAIEPAAPVNRPFELLIGQAWVQKMSRGNFLVQHIAVPTYQEAMFWMQRHPDFGSAQVVATYLPTQKLPHYVIVSGPFASVAEARGFVERGAMPKDSWIRSATSMKEQLTPTPAAGDAGKRKEKNG